MTNRIFASIVLMICSVAVHAAKPKDLSGNWIAEVKYFDATDYRRFSLQQSNSTLSGTAGEGVVSGTFNDTNVELQFAPKNGPISKYSAAVKGEELIGSGSSPIGAVQFRAFREPASASPRTHVFEPKEFHRLFSGTIAPALKINPGDTVKTWSVDAGGSDKNNVRRSLGGNPQTGPFYIEGALPGDTVAIHLLKLTLNRDSAISTPVLAPVALSPSYFAELKRPDSYQSTWKLDRERNLGFLVNPVSEKLKSYAVPLQPMLGCVAVAPPGSMAYRTGFLGAYGGNMDYNRLREGTTILLPVFQIGALVFVGDAHAAQGDGELTGNALETSMDIEFTVELIRGQSLGAPLAEDAEYRMAMGIAGSLNEALQAATTQMARWIARDYKLNPEEVASLFGTAMHYDIAEVVDPQYHVVARISKKALDLIGK